MRLRRFSGAVAGASVLTLALIYWMQALIANREPTPPLPRPIVMAAPIANQPVPPPRRPPRIERFPDPQEVPSLPTHSDQATSGTTGIRVPFGRPVPSTPGVLQPPGGNDGPWAADSEYLLLTPIQPAYPTQAERRDLEGTVVLEFTITERGTTTDIAVIRSTHAVFEPAARSALARYRYEPRVVEGVPVAVRGVRVEFVFEFDD